MSYTEPHKHKSSPTTRPSSRSMLQHNVEQLYGLQVANAAKNEGHEQILHFQPGSSLQLAAPFTSADITLCRSFWQWIGHFGWIVYASMVMVVCAASGFTDGDFGGGPSCADGKNVTMCQLKTNLEDTVAEFRFLIAFVLAGFVARVVGVWSERRKNYAALCGATRELTILVNSFLPINVHQDDFVKGARFRLSRWIMLAYELAVLKARNHMDDAIGREYLTKRGLIRGREWESMVPGDRHTTVYFWVQTHLVQLEKSGHLNASYVLSMSQSVSRARSQANDLMSSLDRDLPFPYVNICFVLVALNVLIFSTFKGVLWAGWFYSHGNRLASQPMFWIDILATFAWNLSYTSLYQLCYVLYNPFGNDRLGIAHSLIGGGIQRLSFQLAGVKGRLPIEITRRPPSEKVPTPSLADSQQQQKMTSQHQMQQRLPPVRKLNRDTPSGLLIITEDESIAASSMPSVPDHLSRTVL